MNHIAFVYTEYQQNILFAICLQESIVLDIIFIRKGIVSHHHINHFAKKVVVLDDIPYSWRFLKKYFSIFHEKISPVVDKKIEYIVFSWSIENPLVRLFLNKVSYEKVYLFEDGAGSYMQRGLFQLGIKHFMITKIISFLIDIVSLNFKAFELKNFRGWSLYKGCFPNINIEKNLIHHVNFQKVIEGFTENHNRIYFPKKSIVFIQQPYVEMTILTEEEYIKIYTEAIMKIKKYVSDDELKIIWKLHPRTNIEDEYRRVDILKKQTNIELNIVEEQWNIEYFALSNKNNQIQYFSLGSSALYVILSLVSQSTMVCLIENEMLKQKLPTQNQVNEFYKSVGIKIL